MVWACAVQTKRFAFCAELNVRFLSPVRPNEKAMATAELVANRRDRIFEAKAELRNESGALLATATGKYLPIKSAEAAEMASDFVGDPRWVTGHDCIAALAHMCRAGLPRPPRPRPVGLLLDGQDVDEPDVWCAGQQIG